MTTANVGEPLPDQARFDGHGGAVGPGMFAVKGEGSPFVPPPHEYVALHLHAREGRPHATLHAVPSQPVRGVFESHLFETPRLRLPEWAAIWIEDHLRSPRPCRATVSSGGGPKLIINETSLATLNVDDASVLASAQLTALTLDIERVGEDSLLIIRGRTGGKTISPSPSSTRMEAAPGSELTVSILITRANRCVLFGERPSESGRFPRRPGGLIPRTQAGQLNAAAALAGGGAIYAWCGNSVVHLWEPGGGRIRIDYLSDSRADGLFEPEGAYYVHLPLREIENVLEQVPRANWQAAGAIRGEIALESATGSLGYAINHTGFTAHEEGRHEQRVKGLHARFKLDGSGLWLSLETRLSGYVPGTVVDSLFPWAGASLFQPAGQGIEALVPWESLIIVRSSLVSLRKLLLSRG